MASCGREGSADNYDHHRGEIVFSTTPMIISLAFLFVNGLVIFVLMRNLAELIEKRDCAVRKKMVILPHKIINANFPIFYD